MFEFSGGLSFFLLFSFRGLGRVFLLSSPSQNFHSTLLLNAFCLRAPLSVLLPPCLSRACSPSACAPHRILFFPSIELCRPFFFLSFFFGFIFDSLFHAQFVSFLSSSFSHQLSVRLSHRRQSIDLLFSLAPMQPLLTHRLFVCGLSLFPLFVVVFILQPIQTQAEPKVVERGRAGSSPHRR